MPRQTCSLCGEASLRKMASVYWRWQWPSGDERGYVQKLDPICGAAFFSAMSKTTAKDDECIFCEQSVKYPLGVFVRGFVYIPGRDRVDLELLHCDECLMKNEDRYTQGARRLPDREVGAGGPPPQPNGDDPWAAIGLHP
jgi:hypothetical protein